MQHWQHRRGQLLGDFASTATGLDSKEDCQFVHLKGIHLAKNSAVELQQQFQKLNMLLDLISELLAGRKVVFMYCSITCLVISIMNNLVLLFYYPCLLSLLRVQSTIAQCMV